MNLRFLPYLPALVKTWKLTSQRPGTEVNDNGTAHNKCNQGPSVQRLHDRQPSHPLQSGGPLVCNSISMPYKHRIWRSQQSRRIRRQKASPCSWPLVHWSNIIPQVAPSLRRPHPAASLRWLSSHVYALRNEWGAVELTADHPA